MMSLRRKVDDDDTTRAGIVSFAQPRKHAVAGVVDHQPFETCALAIKFMQGRQCPIEMIEITDKSLDSTVLSLVEQMPIQRPVVLPFRLLTEFATHEHELLARMAEQETIIGTQVREPLPFVPRHSAKYRTLAMDNFIVRERQDEVFGERVKQRECNLVVMVFAMDRIPAHVSERVIHPAHVPFIAKAEAAGIDRS